MTAKRGTELHALAHDLIRLKVLLPDNKKTLNRYVNDAIGFRMSTEQTLFYSPNVFGTADAIAYDEDEKFLRIHDLKNGVIEASMMQLKVYMAFFCLEYNIMPNKIKAELRIYQNDEIVIYTPDAHEIFVIRSKIIQFDRRLEELKRGPA